MVMGDNPSRLKGEQHPVENISWDMAKAFIGKLNELVPGLGVRLPSESEWEYGCRAGTTTPFWFGSELTTDMANYNGTRSYNNGKKGEFRNKTMPVKSFKQNPWGLYQMHGNVWEWCEDFWYDNYEGLPDNGAPRLKKGKSDRRVVRGGSWLNDGRDLRSACRLGRLVAGGFFDARGFRLARGPQVQEAGRGLAKEAGKRVARDERSLPAGADGREESI